MLILLLLGPFSGYPLISGGNSPDTQVLFNLMSGTIDPTVSWIAMAVIVLGLAAILWSADQRRRRSGLVAPPPSLTVHKIVVIAIAEILGGALSHDNRVH